MRAAGDLGDYCELRVAGRPAVLFEPAAHDRPSRHAGIPRLPASSSIGKPIIELSESVGSGGRFAIGRFCAIYAEDIPPSPVGCC
jgi:hypothetical protein